MIPGDPYCYRGTDVLVNRYDIRDAGLLHAVEYKFALVREIELEVKPINGVYDFKHLIEIHKHLFQDTYEWAGQVRVLDFAKRNAETGLVNRFTQIIDVPKKIEEFNKFISDHNQLKGLNKAEFIVLFSQVQARLNEIHPFREGNGRSTRIFMTHLARQAGFDFQVNKLDANQWNQASHKALVQHEPKKPGVVHAASIFQMRSLLSKVVRPMIDHAFEFESKAEAVLEYPSVKAYFDRLQSISEKASKLSTPVRPGVSSYFLSAVDHIKQKLKTDRVESQHQDAMSRLSEHRPEITKEGASAYGPKDNSQIVISDLRAIFVKKGYSPEVVEESVVKTVHHISNGGSGQAMLAPVEHLASTDAPNQYERQR